jgi:hypothetical protein
MKKLLLLLSLLTLVSCKSHKGTFTGYEDTTFKGPKYLIGPHKEITIPTGSYEAKLSPGFNNKLTLKITINKETSHEIVFKIPENLDLPDENGELKLSSNQTNQTYDSFINVNTIFTDSEVIDTWERCTYITYQTVCRNVCQIVNGSEVCTYVCREEPVTNHGRQNVSYFIRTSEKSLKIDLLRETQIVADFKSFETSKRKIYEYIGTCY